MTTGRLTDLVLVGLTLFCGLAIFLHRSQQPDPLIQTILAGIAGVYFGRAVAWCIAAVVQGRGK